MPPDDRIAGVVLAGGRSSRMGTDKALLDFHGRALVEHMRDLLARAGCQSVIISGALPGHAGIPDAEPLRGPARAIIPLLRQLDRFDGVLVVPVDMPFLTEAALHELMRHGHSCSFERRPLPALFRPPFRNSDASSMAALLADHQALALPLPEKWEAGMINLNTPQQWREAMNNEPAPRR